MKRLIYLILFFTVFIGGMLKTNATGIDPSLTLNYPVNSNISVEQYLADLEDQTGQSYQMVDNFDSVDFTRFDQYQVTIKTSENQTKKALINTTKRIKDIYVDKYLQVEIARELGFYNPNLEGEGGYDPEFMVSKADLATIGSLYIQNINDINNISLTPNISILSIYVDGVNDYQFINQLMNLTSLTISDSLFQDFSSIASKTSLQELSIVTTKPLDLKNINNLQLLEYLNISDQNISDISFLKQLPNLNMVGLSDNKISDIKILKDLPNIQAIYLDYNMIYDLSSIGLNRNWSAYHQTITRYNVLKTNPLVVENILKDNTGAMIIPTKFSHSGSYQNDHTIIYQIDDFTHNVSYELIQENKYNFKVNNILVNQTQPVIQTSKTETSYNLGARPTSSQFIQDIQATTDDNSPITVDFSQVDFNHIGVYEATLTAQDPLGNQATPLTIVVKIIKAPIITSDQSIGYQINSNISHQQFLEDISAYVDEETSIESDFEDIVDFSSSNVYTVTLSASKDGLNANKVEVKVIVGYQIKTLSNDQNFNEAIKTSLNKTSLNDYILDEDLINLKSLKIQGVQSLEPLILVPNLLTLEIVDSPNVTSYRPILNCPSIETLVITNSLSNQVDLSFINKTNLNNLKSLLLNDNHLASLPVISSFDYLYKLDLSNNQLTNLDFIKGISRIDILNLKNNQLTDISQLKNIKLNSVYLDNNAISDVTPLANVAYDVSVLNQIINHGEVLINNPVVFNLPVKSLPDKPLQFKSNTIKSISYNQATNQISFSPEQVTDGNHEIKFYTINNTMHLKAYSGSININLKGIQKPTITVSKDILVVQQNQPLTKEELMQTIGAQVDLNAQFTTNYEEIDWSTIGTYSFKLNAQTNTQQANQVVVTIKVVAKPIINSLNTITYERTSVKTESQFLQDISAQLLEGTIKTTFNQFNLNQVGDFQVILTGTSNYGFEVQSKQIQVKVVDTTKPIISTNNSSNEIILEYNESLTQTSFLNKLNLNSNEPMLPLNPYRFDISQINTSVIDKVGKNVIVYGKDLAGNESIGLSFNVKVIDTSPPSLKLLKTSLTLEYMVVYSESQLAQLLGATSETGATFDILNYTSIYTSTIQTKQFLIQAIDNNGVKSPTQTITLTVKDTKAPTFTLLKTSQTLEYKVVLSEAKIMQLLGAKTETGATYDIVNFSSTYFNLQQTKQFQAIAIDSNGNKSMPKTITLTVKDTKPPVISSLSSYTFKRGYSMTSTKFTTVYKVSIKDYVTRSYDYRRVNFKRAGTYYAYINAKDNNGLTSKKTVKVIIK